MLDGYRQLVLFQEYSTHFGIREWQCLRVVQLSVLSAAGKSSWDCEEDQLE